MTGADVGRFVLLIALGMFAFLAFLYAGTIVGLMWLESSYCNCLYFPVGLYVLALLAILAIATMISEAIDMPMIVQGWVDRQKHAELQEAFIIALIFIVIMILILF
jgi:hypothetical protein